MNHESELLNQSLMVGWGDPLDEVGHNLMSPKLGWRPKEARFNQREMSRLSIEVHEAWIDLLKEASFSSGIGDLSRIVTIDTYPNGSPKVVLTESGLKDWPEMRHTHKMWSLQYNVNNYGKLKALEVALEALDNPEVVVSTLELPGQLGDRPASTINGGVEVVEMQTTFRRLRKHGVRGIISCDNHSPAATWWMMEAGIVGVDLSMMPLLINKGVEMGLIGSTGGVKFNSFDRGAVPRNLMGRLYLQGRMEMHPKAIAVGEKKKNGLTEKYISYDGDDLDNGRGLMIVSLDDRMVGGGTMRVACEQFMQSEPLGILVVASHLYGTNGYIEAVNELSSRLKGRFHILTTDSVESLCNLKDLTDQESVIVLSVKHLPEKLGELVRSEMDFWSDQGLEVLEKLGMCLAAWHYPGLTRDFPSDGED